MIQYDLLYDGPRLQWRGRGIFKATSGLQSRQEAWMQCNPKGGPIPEGSYFLWLREDPSQPKPDDTCALPPSWALQTIPRGADAGPCEPYWALWGRNRVRLIPGDDATRRSCPTHRDGFYLHDSTKGYTHGCIEVEGRFFEMLRHVVAVAHSPHSNLGDRLTLLVKYLPGQLTNGGTFRFG